MSEDMTSGPPDNLSDEQLAELAGLADGTLPADRRAEAEARVAASPQLRSALQRQMVALEALRGTTEIGAPARLRADIERRKAGRARRPAPVAYGRRALVAAGIAAVLAAVLVLPGALSGGLSVQDAAAFAQKPPTAGAPGKVPGTPQLLQAEVDGVPFPDYAAKFGWNPVGTRHDERNGRDATTVYYEKNGRTVAYTIVSGDALDPPSDARTTTRNGVEYRSFRDDGRAVVTWERDGHTCVLSSTAAPRPALVALADWRGKGAIPF
jgi:anti-sigma factor RsiW